MDRDDYCRRYVTLPRVEFQWMVRELYRRTQENIRLRRRVACQQVESSRLLDVIADLQSVRPRQRPRNWAEAILISNLEQDLIAQVREVVEAIPPGG